MGVDRTAELDMLREQDEISSVQFAVETVRLWAGLYDELHPPEADESNTQIVDNLLASEDRIRAAYWSGHNGYVRFPVAMSSSVGDELRSLFGRPIHNYRIPNQPQSARRIAIDQIIAETLGVETVLDPATVAVTSFARRIIGAHSIYQYLDERVSKRYKAYQAKPDEARIMPGKEEQFWGATLFGVRNSPGVFDTQGSLSRLLGSIHTMAKDLYGDRADQFLDAWWATVNTLKPAKGSLKGAIREPLAALLLGDLGTARYVLKERLFNDRELLPYRSRARFSLDDDEASYFAELFTEPAPASAPAPEEESPLPPDRLMLLRQAESYIGTLITFENSHHESMAAYVRGIGYDTRVNRRQSLQEVSPEGVRCVVPYVLILDYFGMGDDGSFTRHRMGGRGKQIHLAAFDKLLQRGNVEIVDRDEKYADRDVRSFHVNG